MGWEGYERMGIFSGIVGRKGNSVDVRKSPIQFFNLEKRREEKLGVMKGEIMSERALEKEIGRDNEKLVGEINELDEVSVVLEQELREINDRILTLKAYRESLNNDYGVAVKRNNELKKQFEESTLLLSSMGIIMSGDSIKSKGNEILQINKESSKLEKDLKKHNSCISVEKEKPNKSNNPSRPYKMLVKEKEDIITRLLLSKMGECRA